MLTGQFHELSDLIGSGVPVKIYKLDNNQTSKVVQVDQFTDAQDIPYPWAGDSWESAFIGYSISRNVMEAPGVITGPTILYCFYDAEVSITFKLPLPKSKEITIAYGKGQRPQARDITGSDLLLKQAAITRGVDFSLSDGTPIDSMRKPIEDTTVEVVLCNQSRDVTFDKDAPFAYAQLLYTSSNVIFGSESFTFVNGEVDIQPVSYHIPRAPDVSVTSTVNSTAGKVPSYLRTFRHDYTAIPKVSPVSVKAYIENYYSQSISFHLVEFPENIFGRVGTAIGSSTSSVPTSYPSVPSLKDKGSWTDGNGDTYYGAVVNGSIDSGKYRPFNLYAELKQYTTYRSVIVRADEIIMSRAPKLTSGTTTDKSLLAWLRTNVHADDQDVALWWRDNYQRIFLSSN